MDWKTRHKIAIGTAKGLHYLHKSCPRRIIHRDIKASNVLLTTDFEPQVPFPSHPISHGFFSSRKYEIPLMAFPFFVFLGQFLDI